jgi:hypothetical protein
MGTSHAYDEWFDVGKSFGEDEVAGFRLAAIPEARVKWLLDKGLVISRLLELPGGTKKPKWWEEVRKHFLDIVTWDCVVAGLPGISRESVWDLPDASTVLGKELTVQAHGLEAFEFIEEWKAGIDRALRAHVTMSRACYNAPALSEWTKTERSTSNKISNALVREMRYHDKCAESLSNRTSLKDQK